MTRLNKKDLIACIAASSARAGVNNGTVIQIVLDAALREIAAAVDAGDSVVLPGFGTFKPRHRAARMGRNPRTGEAVEVQASTTISFTASRRPGA